MKKTTIIKGAVILTAAGIVTRILGFFYRIYMTKHMGAEGMGVYQCISPLYLLVWAISSSGFTTAVSRLTAQEKAKGNIGNIHRILLYAVFISVCISLVLSFLLHHYSTFIAVSVLKDIRTARSLSLLSYCFPCMAAGSVIRGYFFGMQSARIPATSQIIEQCVRIGSVYIFSDTLMQKGVEFSCAAAVIGMAAGEIISFLYTGICYLYYTGKIKSCKPPTISVRYALFLLISTAAPLGFNRIFGSALSALENILIPQRLQLFGYTQSEALEIYGKLCGMALPLAMFPSSLLTAISTALMPAISEGYTLKQHNEISTVIQRTLTVACIISVITSAVFISYPYEIGYIIYHCNIGGILRFIGILCPLIYIQVVFSGILNGFGEQLFIFYSGLISAGINIFFVYFLMPCFGLNAYFLGWFISAVLVCVLSVIKIKKRVSLNFNLTGLLTSPICSATAASLMSLLLRNYIGISLGITARSFVCVSLMCVVYLLLLYISGYLPNIHIKNLLR